MVVISFWKMFKTHYFGLFAYRVNRPSSRARLEEIGQIIQMKRTAGVPTIQTVIKCRLTKFVSDATKFRKGEETDKNN